MTVQSFTRVVQLPARGQITIPTEFRRRLGLEDGALLRMRLVGDKIEIEPLAMTEAGLRLYTDEELRQFQAEDKIDAESVAAVRRLLAAGEL
jgi:AbrB family looped-hinge helix DNA binding protein